MRNLLAGASLVLIAACADRARVTGPPDAETESTANPAAIAARADAAAAVEDAIARVLPGMEADGRTNRSLALSEALRGLGATLASGGAPQSSALDSLASALDAMEADAAGARGTLAELGAVRRLLSRVSELSRPARLSMPQP
jgi:hypothetical protein